ncbi:protein phosphatase 2C domain-containing protein [Oceanobacillus sp. CFH 90083]|uniref:protein phosphatase 2C domain-containing protein n=1 Tax=Oceanobacillus sp. CFH 90083 TaxID=2592336 RepID=UPI00128E2CBE|nr:protein phosphatase 2C domain-containing protein [Oceanobacillus sp. CFH 90083]
MNKTIDEFIWIGSKENFVDKINIHTTDNIFLGRFGGNSAAGQYKNEDGCLVWTNKKWDYEFAVILDAHNSADSATLILKQLSKRKQEIQDLLALPYKQTYTQLENTILNIFQEKQFLSDCRKVQGESSCLIVVRKNKYVWWFSIGDCLACIFHSELALLGQYQMNQRQFYEWIGQVNTFEQPVPCYSSGIRELRKGINRIFLTTDGLIECPNDPFSSPEKIYNVIKRLPINEGLMTLLNSIKENNVRDSTTILSWDVNITEDVTFPSDE